MGFVHEVDIKYHPHLGVCIAYYKEERIAERMYSAIREPFSDNEREWERYEELFGEWSDAAKWDLSIECRLYFDKQLIKS